MNKVFQVIYSEARNGYVVVSELAKTHGKGVHSRRRKTAVLTAVVLSALASFSWAGMPEAQAAASAEPVTIDKPGQVVTDDFYVEDCTKPAVVDIAAFAAKTTKDVTKVDTKNITATFSNPNEANGIWVQDDYPGTVKLAGGLHISIDSDAYDYNSSGIYLEGVDVSRDSQSRDESMNANKEYKANDNKISDIKVEVGHGTSITLKAGLGTDKDRTDVMATGLENQHEQQPFARGGHLRHVVR